MTSAAVRSGWLCRAIRSSSDSCAWFHHAGAKQNAVDSALVYFYTEEIDIFWHNLAHYKPGENGYVRQKQLRAETLKLHNRRVREDWADYNEGRSGQPGRLQSLQARILLYKEFLVHSGGVQHGN